MRRQRHYAEIRRRFERVGAVRLLGMKRARLALFLASDDSSWITGAAIALDGGFTAG